LSSLSAIASTQSKSFELKKLDTKIKNVSVDQKFDKLGDAQVTMPMAT